ncbi:MAG: 1-acyl-sn-glycerol-3-phosphate acyltransferase [Candidatus Paceibacterota bacterium]|jgi:1-acyl-sn-glycerol-3-phosphate acyltransferase
MNKIISSDHPMITLCYWILRKIVGIPIRFFLVRKVRGLQNIPTNGSVILAFNHQSFFDFICFAAVAPRNVHFLSAEKFFEHKWWRILMIVTGQIRVNRTSNDKHDVHISVKKHVEKHSLIGIFPEGTRSPHKEDMLKAFTGVAQFALKHHIPIIPVGIIGTYNIMSKHDSKPNIKKIVEINIGLPLRFNEHHDKDNDREICLYVTEMIMKELEKLSGKKYKHYESKFIN